MIKASFTNSCQKAQNNIKMLCLALITATLLSCVKSEPEINTPVTIQLEIAGADAAALQGLPIQIGEGWTGDTFELTSDANGRATIALPYGYYTVSLQTKRRLEGLGNVTLLAQPIGVNVVDTNAAKNTLILPVDIYFE